MRVVIAMGFAIILSFSASVQAATINYGNLTSPAVKYISVTESSGTDPVPLYDTPFLVGDDLFFSATGFTASATNGDIDITDGQLDFQVIASPGIGIDSFELYEAGDFRLLGTGTADTFVDVSALGTLTITHVDGVLVAPIVVNADFSETRTLPVDGGPLSPWTGGFTIDLNQVLDNNSITYTQGVTQFNYFMDNQLLAFSEPGTVAFIAKKEVFIDLTINGTPDPQGGVPEPSSVILLGLVSMFAAGFVKYRKK